MVVFTCTLHRVTAHYAYSITAIKHACSLFNYFKSDQCGDVRTILCKVLGVLGLLGVLGSSSNVDYPVHAFEKVQSSVPRPMRAT